MPCKAQHGLSALDMAVTGQLPDGVHGKGLSRMSDNGGQPTSTACMRACGTLGLRQAFTSDDKPQGQAATERLMRPLKEAGRWLPEWTCPFRLIGALDSWMADDNAPSLPSSRGSISPRKFERAYDASHSTPCVAA